MTLADDFGELSNAKHSEKEKNDYNFRMNQLHKMIKEAAKSGKTSLGVHYNFFEDAVGEKVFESLQKEGFDILPFNPNSPSNFFRGIKRGNWLIFWH